LIVLEFEEIANSNRSIKRWFPDDKVSPFNKKIPFGII